MIFEGIVFTLAWPLLADAMIVMGFLFAITLAVVFFSAVMTVWSPPRAFTVAETFRTSLVPAGMTIANPEDEPANTLCLVVNSDEDDIVTVSKTAYKYGHVIFLGPGGWRAAAMCGFV